MNSRGFRAVLALSVLLILLSALFVGAQEKAAGEKKEKKELKVVAEDELAPVRAIEKAIKARLAEPMEEADLELIMEGEDFFGAQPRGVRWDGDGSRFWLNWKRWNEEERGTWEYDLASGELRRLTEDEAEMVPPSFTAWNRDHTAALWTVGDALMLYDVKSKEVAPLLENVRGARPIGFSETGSHAMFRFGDNAYALSLNGEGPALVALTDVRSGSKRSDEPKTDSQKWLKEQQLSLFTVLRDRHDEREEDRAREEARAMQTFYLKGSRLGSLSPSDNMEFVAATLMKSSSKNRMAEMPSYVTESGYTETRPIRNKVGDDLDSRSLAIIHAGSGASANVDFGLEKRDVSFFGVQWSPDSSKALVHLRATDNKDRWLAVLTPEVTKDEDGKMKLEVAVNIVFTDHDDAWINWSVARGNGWLPDGSGVYVLSEKEGDRRHLYAVDADGENLRALTSGDFEVNSPGLTDDRTHFIYTASLPGNPHEVQTFLLPVGGGEAKQITSGAGRADGTLSPKGDAIAIVASSTTLPHELYVNRGISGDLGEKITDSPSPSFKSHTWQTPKLIHFTARDGVEVPAQVYEPATPASNKPAVVFVHGAGYMQNVHHWWRGSSYGRTYCFNSMLAELGYYVIDIDYRGSAGYGRDWRTAIYTHMGGKDLTDQVDGVKYLIDTYGINPKRVGLYGGSYGGFITLMALFLEPETFAAGAAMRPVTDWSAYNNGYTSNILNTPQDDPESYLRSSPIYFAENLQGALLICHGIVDDNVHFQGVVRLVQRLIELRKENWELAIYPVERHGFQQPSSWVDEYRRILKLFNENLKN